MWDTDARKKKHNQQSVIAVFEKRNWKLANSSLQYEGYTNLT